MAVDASAACGDELDPQGCLELYHDIGTGHAYLSDPRLFEVHRLLPAPHGEAWSLELSDEGWGMIVSDSETHWANNFLDNDIYQDRNGLL